MLNLTQNIIVTLRYFSSSFGIFCCCYTRIFFEYLVQYMFILGVWRGGRIGLWKRRKWKNLSLWFGHYGSLTIRWSLEKGGI